MWMGGTLPLGYDKTPDKNIRGLVVNEKEAQNVKRIFDLYLERENLNATMQALKEENILAKNNHNHFTRSTLHAVLLNPLYIGKIRHKDKIYDGIHEPIIELVIWEKVQHQLQNNNANKRGSQNNVSDLAWLKGKFRDEQGDSLTPSHTKKYPTKPKGENENISSPQNSKPLPRIFRYYISHRLMCGKKDQAAWRLPAKAFENLVRQAIITHLENAHQTQQLYIIDDIASYQLFGARLKAFLGNAHNDTGETNTLLRNIIIKGEISKTTLTIELNFKALAEFFQITANKLNDEIAIIKTPLNIKKRGVESKLIIGSTQTTTADNIKEALALGHLWLDEVKNDVPISDIAKRENKSESFIRSRINLSFLSPNIQKQIFLDQFPAHITLQKLTRAQFSSNWQEQDMQIAVL